MIRWRPRKDQALSLLLAAIFLHAGGRAAAQESAPLQVQSLVREAETHPLPRNAARPGEREWEVLEADKAFGYRDVHEFQPIKTPREEPPYEPSFLSRMADAILRFFSGTAGRVLFWALLIAIVGFIVYRIIGPGGWRRRYRADPAGTADGSGDEEDLSADWDARMRNAVSAGNLRLAVRCGYMRYLQVLQEAGLIRYRLDKTNAEYYRELAEPAQKDAFRRMSRQYEFAWYGQYEPSPAAFEAFAQLLNSTKSRLHAA